jgi:hypothetical protein
VLRGGSGAGGEGTEHEVVGCGPQWVARLGGAAEEGEREGRVLLGEAAERVEDRLRGRGRRGWRRGGDGDGDGGGGGGEEAVPAEEEEAEVGGGRRRRQFGGLSLGGYDWERRTRNRPAK